jgi:hypothetical protein
VQLETKVTGETPVGAQPATTTGDQRPEKPEPYVRQKAERQKQERVKQERKPVERKKRDKKRQGSTSDRSMRRY